MFQSTRLHRADTLLELVVTLMLTGVMVLMMLGWVQSILVGSNIETAAAAPSSDMNYLTTTLSSDFTSAVVCADAGIGVPFYTFSSNEIGLYEADPATAGQVDLVLWQYSNNSISRAVIAPSGSACNFDTGDPIWTQIAGNVSSVTFIPMYQGSVATTPPPLTVGACSGAVGSTNDPANCYYDAVEVDATLTSTVGRDTEAQSMTHIFPVNLADSSLSPLTPTTNP